MYKFAFLICVRYFEICRIIAFGMLVIEHYAPASSWKSGRVNDQRFDLTP